MKGFLKKAATFLGIFGLAAVIGLPVWRTLATNTPRFNQLAGDEEFLRGRNTAQTSGGWTDPVAANDGDVVDVQVWYHNNASNDNGDPGAAAINTKVKIELPTGDNTSHIITGSIGADNAATVTGTVVDGVEVGHPGLTINTPLPTSLSLVSGSVRWYPNGQSSPAVLPNGQTGDEIVTGSGINLGDINGCWRFAGVVRFQVRLNQAGAPNLVRSKSAVNETQNQPATATRANAGDVITYTLRVQNTGTRPDNSFIINDDLRDVLAYADFVRASDGGTLQNGFVVYPATAIAAGATVNRTVTVQIKSADQWPSTGDFTLTNVYGNQIDVPVQPPVGHPAVTIDKSVKDASGNYVNETTTTTGQTMTYRVVIKNTGSVTLTNLTILDQPATGLEYVPGSTTVERDGRTWAVGDDIVSAGGLHLTDSVRPDQTVTVYLQLKTAANAANDQRLVNTAIVRSDQTTEQRDDATVVAKVTPPTTPTTPVTSGPTLPTTGAGDAGLLAAGLAVSGVTSVRYWRAKRRLARATNRVAR